MLNEIKFAKENGIELEVEVNGEEVTVIRTTDNGVFVITLEEAKELGLVTEEKKKEFKGYFFLNNKRFSTMDRETFEKEIEKFASKFHEKKQIRYGVVFETKEDLLEFVKEDWLFVRGHCGTMAEDGRIKRTIQFRTNISKKSFFDNKNAIKNINFLLKKIEGEN